MIPTDSLSSFATSITIGIAASSAGVAPFTQPVKPNIQIFLIKIHKTIHCIKAENIE